jgi:hypothetical protein
MMAGPDGAPVMAPQPLGPFANGHAQAPPPGQPDQMALDGLEQMLAHMPPQVAQAMASLAANPGALADQVRNLLTGLPQIFPAGALVGGQGAGVSSALPAPGLLCPALHARQQGLAVRPCIFWGQLLGCCTDGLPAATPACSADSATPGARRFWPRHAPVWPRQR